jgi:putative ABC transport system permease protein
MSLWKVAWRSIQQRALASSLTAVSMALGVALVIAVLVIWEVIYQSFHRGGEGYDLIVGAKGSPETLVLNTVYFLSQPVGSIPYSYYENLVEGRTGDPLVDRNVELAVPVCMGHSYRGFRVVGTTPEMFDKLTYRENRKFQWATGGNFAAERPFDGVVGWNAARETGLTVGATFQAVHGLAEEGGKLHTQTFNVVGILEQTGTPVDRAIFINMEGFYQVHEQEQGAEQDHDRSAPKQISAVLVRLASAKVQDKEGAPGGELVTQTETVARRINDGKDAQAVVPGRVIVGLFEGIVGKIQSVLLVMAVLIVVVAGIGIMVSIYNSMSERRHDIAIMRALGASRFIVMLVILFESILLSLGGGLLGLFLGHSLVGLLSPAIVQWTGVALSLFQFRLNELILIPGLVLLASIVGYLPALAAYRTDVARSLINTP